MKGSHNSKAVHSLLPQSLAATTNNGTGVDCLGYKEARAIFLAGATTSNGSHAVKIQESSDNGVADAFADVTDASFTAITTSNDNALYEGRIDLEKRSRYLRFVHVGTNQAILGAALFELSNPAVGPATPVNTLAFNV